MPDIGFLLADRWVSAGRPDEAGLRIVLHAMKGWRAIRWLGPGYYEWTRVGSGYDWRWSKCQWSTSRSWYFHDTTEWAFSSYRRIDIDQSMERLRLVVPESGSEAVAA